MPNESHAPSPVEAILQLTTGIWTTQAPWAAASLGVADALAAGPKTSAALAETTSTLPRVANPRSVRPGRRVGHHGASHATQ